MSFNSPRTLQELAEKSLLSNQTVAISYLDIIPSVFFPSLFKKACRRRKTSIVKAMVQAWPFPCLPLGAMIKRGVSYMRVLEMILSGIDGMLCQEVPHRRCRLKVLDLRILPLRMWDQWSVFKAPDLSENQTALDLSEKEVKPRVKVAIDLVLISYVKESLESFVIKWVSQREGLSLWYNKLEIWSMNKYIYYYHKAVLDTLDFNCVQHLVLGSMDGATSLLNVSPYVRRMRYLRSFSLRGFYACCQTPAQQQQIVSKFTSHFAKMKHLEALILNDVFFPETYLGQSYWSLKTPLETLSLTKCYLSNSEWAHIAEFPCTSQLKHLHLESVQLSLEVLQAVLRRSASTLLTLDLESCHLFEHDLRAILPAVRCCTQLISFNFSGNHFSWNFLREMRDHERTMRSEGSRVVFMPRCDDLSPEL